MEIKILLVISGKKKENHFEWLNVLKLVLSMSIFIHFWIICSISHGFQEKIPVIIKYFFFRTEKSVCITYIAECIHHIAILHDRETFLNYRQIVGYYERKLYSLALMTLAIPACYGMELQPLVVPTFEINQVLLGSLEWTAYENLNGTETFSVPTFEIIQHLHSHVAIQNTQLRILFGCIEWIQYEVYVNKELLERNIYLLNHYMRTCYLTEMKIYLFIELL